MDFKLVGLTIEEWVVTHCQDGDRLEVIASETGSFFLRNPRTNQIYVVSVLEE